MNEPHAAELVELDTDDVEIREDTPQERAFKLAYASGDPEAMAAAALDHMIANGELDLPPEGGNRHTRRAYAKKRDKIINDARCKLHEYFIDLKASVAA